MGAEVCYGNVHLSTAFALPELYDCAIEGAPVLHLDVSERVHPSPDSWTHHWLFDDDIALSVARIGGRHLLEFEDGRTFLFDDDARVVSGLEPIDASFRHQLLDQVLPRVLEHLGHLMIHASAVRTPHGVVMFMADAGAGKSTLAASFQSAGVELLSDDCMQLIVDPDDAVGCLPTYRSLRLWSDSADAIMAGEPYEPMATGSAKRRLELADTPAGDPAAVTAICVLSTDEHDSQEIAFSPVTPARAVSLLLAQCFRLDPTDAAATKRTFERCADVVERVPVVELSYPREYERLPDVRNAVLERAARGDWTDRRAPSAATRA